LCDYGSEVNKNKYGTETPTVVDFRNIKTNIAVISGKYDLGITYEDTELLKE